MGDVSNEVKHEIVFPFYLIKDVFEISYYFYRYFGPSPPPRTHTLNPIGLPP